MKEKTKATFESEAAMCAAFLARLPDGWTAYPETAGFDIVLLRVSDGVQIGIEAKLTLNAKVMNQIVEDRHGVIGAGPDFRAVLVPWGCTGSLGVIPSLLGVTVITVADEEVYAGWWHSNKEWFSPTLPGIQPLAHHWGDDRWHDWCPWKRCQLPDYVPDVGAGHSAPLQLTAWKIKAIRIRILLERVGYVTRHDFKALGLDHRRWLEPAYQWLAHGDRRGLYVAGEQCPDFRAQHPVNYEQIAADFDKWKPPTVPLPMHQEALL